MSEKNNREDLIVLSRGTWDLILDELTTNGSESIPSIIKSARRRNPKYSAEVTESSLKAKALERKHKLYWRGLHQRLSEGKGVWLRVVSGPNEYSYVPITVGPNTTHFPYVEVFYLPPGTNYKQSVTVNVDWIVTELHKEAKLSSTKSLGNELNDDRYKLPYRHYLREVLNGKQ